MGVARAILGFIGWQGLIALGVIGMLFIEKHEHRQTKDDLAAVELTLTQERAAHLKTQLNYREAADKARREDAQNKARAEAEQRANIERQKRDYEERIARARADAERLRQRAEARPNPGSSGTAPVPGDRSSGPSAPGAPEDHGLSIEERLIATEQAIQLDELIDYVEGLLKVDMDGREPPARRRP